MANIELPRHHWFFSRNEGRFVTNQFSGSLGTLPNRGCLRFPTFQYRVRAVCSLEDDKTYTLVAECYVLQPFFQGANQTDYTCQSFDNSEAGVRQASEWLSQIATQHGY